MELFTGYIREPFYYETDQMGIIHHSNYIRWLEESRVALLDYLGFSYKKIEELGPVSYTHLEELLLEHRG